MKELITGRWGGKGQFDETPKPIRFFYRFKGLACLIADREPSRRAAYDLWIAGVPVVYTASGTSDGGDSQISVRWFECVLVGRGLFTNWWATYYQASD